MDEYTQKTKAWLDERFKLFDEQGIYLAHQPIYGFHEGHCEKFSPVLSRYVPTYQILKALSHLEFSSLLDVGGAEGYKAALVREIFGTGVRNSDLSEEACKRAEEIFDVDSDPVDIHNLPYKDGQFDVVLCSECLEHAKDAPKALAELLRVAAKAVVITVPHDSKEVIKANIRNEKIHGHRWVFSIDSFNFLKTKGYRVITKKMLSPYAYLPILGKYLDQKSLVAFLTTFDDLASRLLPTYGGILVIVLKKSGTIHLNKNGNVLAYRILNFAVPKYYLRRKDESQSKLTRNQNSS